MVTLEVKDVKETWGFVWLAAALSAIVLVSMLIGSTESGFPAFFCFLPIVFVLIARSIKNLAERVSILESALEKVDTTQ